MHRRKNDKKQKEKQSELGILSLVNNLLQAEYSTHLPNIKEHMVLRSEVPVGVSVVEFGWVSIKLAQTLIRA